MSTDPGPTPQPQQPHRLSLFEWLPYLYLLRVPLLVGLVLFVLPILAITSLRQLLANLFIPNLWGLFWAVLGAYMVAGSVLVEWRVILLNGQERFGVRPGLRQDRISWGALLAAELLPLPTVAVAVLSGGPTRVEHELGARFATAFGAFVAAHIVAYGVLFFSVLVAPRYPPPAGERFPLLFNFMRMWLNWAYTNTWKDKFDARVRESTRKWPEWLRAGYVERREGPNKDIPFPGQWLAVVLALATLLLYLVMGGLRMAGVGLPAIAYVLLLLLLAGWWLAGAAFLLDRFRVPLLVPMALFIVAGNWFPLSDHYFPVSERADIRDVEPNAVLTSARRAAPDAERKRGRVVVVATAGGGIQAAGWTARVLAGLEEELDEGPKPAKFADSIALISSVSGGAVGTMFFVNQYDAGPGGKGFARVAKPSPTEQAESPGLDGIAGAIVYNDIWRVVFPLANLQRKLKDRGWALEQTWREEGNVRANLADWREGVVEGLRPAVIFNSTAVETGEPLFLATTNLSNPHSRESPKWHAFGDLFPGSDVPVVTAVRLAATFPYVTPVSRADWSKGSYHFADGGYYDNFGVYALLVWLDEALESTPEEKRPDVLIIQIRSFPSAITEKMDSVGSQGWSYQTWAPLDALMATRSTGQLVRDRDAVKRFMDLWSRKGAVIRSASFEFRGEDAPLSWAMNPAQAKAIDEQWSQRVSGKWNQDWKQVRCFFSELNDGNRKACAKDPW